MAIVLDALSAVLSMFCCQCFAVCVGVCNLCNCDVICIAYELCVFERNKYV